MESPLYHARRRAGMTQQDAADAWNRAWPDDPKPKTAKALSYWETDARQPSVASLRRLADVYGCSVADLLEIPVQASPADRPAPATTALAVVARGDEVLLVQRAETLRWQLPAGAVKPEATPERVVVRETRAETGISVSVRGFLGERVHPESKVLCRYYACDYLAGDVVNGDVEENADVVWAPIGRLDDFIPAGLFGPVVEYLRGARV